MQIYKTTNIINGKIYIGQNLTDDPNYLGSGTLLWRAIKKYGIQNFEKEILEQIDDRNLVDEREIYWINYYRSILSLKYIYNITNGGHGFGDVLTHHPDKNIIIEKISKTLKLNNSKLSIEERKTKFGKPGELNGMFKNALKYYCKCGKTISKKAKSCNKCRDRSGKNNPFFNKKHSEESLTLMSAGSKGLKAINRRKVEANNIQYDCIEDAAKALNCVCATILYRINKKKDGYNYL